MTADGPPADAQREALDALHDLGTLSDEEHAAAIGRLAAVTPADGAVAPGPASPDAHDAAPRRKRVAIVSAAVLLLLGAVVGGFALMSGGSQSVGPLRGRLTVPQYGSQLSLLRQGLTSGSECLVEDGYDDIQAGADVTVRDASNKIIATSRLSAPTQGTEHCFFDFTVDKFKASGIISIEVAHRGALTYKLRELKAVGWHVSMTLG